MNPSDVPKVSVKARAAGELLDGDNGPKLLRWSLEFQKGYPTSGDGPSSKGAVSDPTFRACLERDEFHHRGHPFAYWLEKLYEASAAVIELGLLLTPIDPDKVDRTRQASGGDCSACGRYVPGTAEDRLKAGYCAADYEAWKRTDKGAGRMDRLVFEAMRREAS